VPTCIYINLIFLPNSSEIRSWYFIFYYGLIYFSTSTIICGCSKKYLQPLFSMHCTSEWFISFFTVCSHFPPWEKTLFMLSESRPLGTRLRIFSISEASLYLWLITLRDIRMAVDTTLLMLSLGLYYCFISSFIYLLMVGFSNN
jgi:hypothetical protein